MGPVHFCCATQGLWTKEDFVNTKEDFAYRHFTETADQQTSISLNTPDKNVLFSIIHFFFSIFTWLYDPLMTVCIIYSIVWGTQTCCPFYRHHFRLRKLHLHSFCCKCIWQLEMIAVAAKMELVDANIPSILLKGGTEHLPFENVTR